ncbi:hypothetical protein QUR48_24265, partial [Salmonella enterica]|uniref:hypothetical protein n=1 Tax=Salmonella enterica TaxID=28901 RepID=UPI00352867CE
YRHARGAENPGTGAEASAIKDLRGVPSGYQQSYPQNFGISPKSPRNQALAGRIAGEAAIRGPA